NRLITSIWLYENRHDGLRQFLFGGSPGNADWEGGKAHSIGIRPVHWSGRLWTGERRCAFPPNHGDYSAVIEARQARSNAGMSDLLLLGARHRALGYKRASGASFLAARYPMGGTGWPRAQP